MEKIKCPKCGIEVEDNNLFCDICGSKINKAEHSRMNGKQFDENKIVKNLDGYAFSLFIRFIALYIISAIIIGFGIFMATLGTKVWLVLVIFLASLISGGIATYLLFRYLKYKKGDSK